jgi:hypothetical protein
MREKDIHVEASSRGRDIAPQLVPNSINFESHQDIEHVSSIHTPGKPAVSAAEAEIIQKLKKFKQVFYILKNHTF